MNNDLRMRKIEDRLSVLEGKKPKYKLVADVYIEEGKCVMESELKIVKVYSDFNEEDFLFNSADELIKELIVQDFKDD